MTIYKIVENENGEVFSAEPLPPGEHTLEHGGACIAVDVLADDTVRVLLDSFTGKPKDLYVAGIDGDGAQRSIVERGEIRAMEIKTREETAVGLLGIDDGLDTSLVLRPLSEMPAIRGERG